MSGEFAEGDGSRIARQRHHPVHIPLARRAQLKVVALEIGPT
jgi:hypothetical protein